MRGATASDKARHYLDNVTACGGGPIPPRRLPSLFPLAASPRSPSDAYQFYTQEMSQRAREKLELDNALWRARARRIRAALPADQGMPGISGVQFLREVKHLYPDTVRIVLSGHTELASVTSAVNEGAVYKFLTKPWEDDELRTVIAEAFHQHDLLSFT